MRQRQAGELGGSLAQAYAEDAPFDDGFVGALDMIGTLHGVIHAIDQLMDTGLSGRHYLVDQETHRDAANHDKQKLFPIAPGHVVKQHAQDGDGARGRNIRLGDDQAGNNADDQQEGNKAIFDTL